MHCVILSVGLSVGPVKNVSWCGLECGTVRGYGRGIEYGYLGDGRGDTPCLDGFV